MTKRDRSGASVVIVGGGLAGLTAALYLVRADRSVSLFERARQVGGRGRTGIENGYYLTFGPHALYRAGPGMTVLRELGIEVDGKVPLNRGLCALRAGKIQPLPATSVTLMRSRLFGWRGKLQLMRLLASIQRLTPRELAQRSVSRWVDDLVQDGAVRQYLKELVRLTTYANDPERQSADVALTQIQLALKANVLYLDEGWGSLVKRLQSAGEVAGVQFVTGARIASVEGDGIARGVRLADGRFVEASAVVLAVDPGTASRLIGRDQDLSLHRWVETSKPVKAACLDLGLRRLPRPERLFALGIDLPLYYSVHSASAKLAPGDGALIHVAKYLPESSDRKADERELEELMDRVQPGWRDEVIVRRFLPRMIVENALTTSAGKGLAGRAPTSKSSR